MTRRQPPGRFWPLHTALLLATIGACGEVDFDAIDALGEARDGEALLAIVEDTTVAEGFRTRAAVVLGRSVRDDPAQHAAWETRLAALRDEAGGGAQRDLIAVALTSLNGRLVAATITQFLDQAEDAVANAGPSVPVMGPDGHVVDAIIADAWLPQFPKDDLSWSGVQSSPFSGMTQAEIEQRASAIEVVGVALRSTVGVGVYECGGTARQVRYRLYRFTRDGRLLGAAVIEGSMPPRTIERAGAQIGGGVVVSAANCTATGSEPDYLEYFSVEPAG